MEIKEFFFKHSEVAVAFSGGVDSAVLLMLAKEHAKRAKAYFVKSQFQPQFELDDALIIAHQLNVELEVIPVDILSAKEVAENPQNRCYLCKKRVFAAILEHAQKDGFKTVLDGTNATDDVADRPGFTALQELEIASPLRLCGYTKADIRRLAAKSSLPVANKPSYACLATRIPFGTAITAELLEKTEAAENEMRDLGFKNFRVRYIDGSAKIELGNADFELFYKTKNEVYALLKPYYQSVCLDLKERDDE